MRTRANRFAMTSPRDPEYFSSMNTTPLIDVLLVLLVMLIITLPVASHKVPIVLPANGPPAAPPVTHRLTIAANGAYGWDGTPLPDEALPPRLAAFIGDPGQPVLVIAADGEARYDRFDHTLATIKRAGITKLGFAGNERWR
jgi:biopolymer transport protein ExbD